MTAADLLPYLLGSTGCLVLSLVLNLGFYTGKITNPKKVVPREDYDGALSIAARNTVALEKRLSDALGLKVLIDHKPNGGKLEIRYRTLEQLDTVITRLDR